MPELRAGEGWPPGGLNDDDGPVLKGDPDGNAGGITVNAGKLQTLIGASAGVIELDGYKERFRTEGDQSATRVFAVPWSARAQWRDQMLGYATTVPNPLGGAPTLTRVIPAQHPESGYEHLYCSDLELTEGRGAWVKNPLVVRRGADGTPVLDGNGKAQPVDMIAYVDACDGTDGFAVYAATYTPRPYTIRADDEAARLGRGELERYVERAGKQALQALALPRGQVKFNVPTVLSGAGETVPGTVSGVNVAGAAIPDNAAFILMPTKELAYVWHDVPDIPWAAWDACEGKVNSLPFDACFGNERTRADGSPDPWPAYTLLCQPPQWERYRTVRGRFSHRLTYTFLYRRQTWLRLPAGVDKNFYAVAYPNGDALFEQADFAALFVPGPPQTYQ